MPSTQLTARRGHTERHRINGESTVVPAVLTRATPPLNSGQNTQNA